MFLVPYKDTHKRVRCHGRAHTGPFRDPAGLLASQGGDLYSAELVRCICRRWRVLYYDYRHAAGLPLGEGAEEFEVAMADVLVRVSSALEPPCPVHSRLLRAGRSTALIRAANRFLRIVPDLLRTRLETVSEAFATNRPTPGSPADA